MANYLSRNLKHLRKLKGYAQAEMYDILGVMGGTWSNYENNNTEPSISKLIEISKLFAVPIDDLLLKDLTETIESTPNSDSKENLQVQKSTPNSTPISTPKGNFETLITARNRLAHGLGKGNLEAIEVALLVMMREMETVKAGIDEIKSTTTL